MQEIKKKIVYLLAIVTSLWLIILIFNTVQTFRAELLVSKILSIDLKKNWPEIEKNITKLLGLKRKDFHYNDIAARLYIRRFAETGKREDYENAARISESAYSQNPFNPYVLTRRIELDYIAIVKGVIKAPAYFTKKSAQAKEKILLDFDETRESLEKFYKIWKDNVINDYIKKRDYDKALSEIENLTARMPALDNHFLRRRVLALVGLNRLDMAIEYGKQLARLKQDKDSYLMLAKIYKLSGNMEKAREMFGVSYMLGFHRELSHFGLYTINENAYMKYRFIRRYLDKDIEKGIYCDKVVGQLEAAKLAHPDSKDFIENLVYLCMKRMLPKVRYYIIDRADCIDKYKVSDKQLICSYSYKTLSEKFINTLDYIINRRTDPSNTPKYYVMQGVIHSLMGRSDMEKESYFRAVDYIASGTD